jgi:rhodanese-related sulfurtransferase
LEFIQQNIPLILLALGSGVGFLFLTFRSASADSGLTPTQATLLINREGAQVIDVRSSDEYVGGHLPESRNIPFDQLETRAGELDRLKEAPLILVCQTGTRSVAASKQLAKLGFTKVNNLAGGIAGWRTAGLPLRKGAKK